MKTTIKETMETMTKSQLALFITETVNATPKMAKKLASEATEMATKQATFKKADLVEMAVRVAHSFKMAQAKAEPVKKVTAKAETKKAPVKKVQAKAETKKVTAKAEDDVLLLDDDTPKAKPVAKKADEGKVTVKTVTKPDSNGVQQETRVVEFPDDLTLKSGTYKRVPVEKMEHKGVVNTLVSHNPKVEYYLIFHWDGEALALYNYSPWEWLQPKHFDNNLDACFLYKVTRSGSIMLTYSIEEGVPFNLPTSALTPLKDNRKCLYWNGLAFSLYSKVVE